MRLYSRKEGSMEERIRKENEIIKGNQMILYRNLKSQKLFDDVCTLLASEKGDNSPEPMPAPIVSLNWQ